MGCPGGKINMAAVSVKRSILLQPSHYPGCQRLSRGHIARLLCFWVPSHFHYFTIQ